MASTTISQIDGVFGVSDLDSISWSDYTSQSLENNQILKVTNSLGMADGIAINKDFVALKTYNEADGTWITEPSSVATVASTLGYNFVYLPGDNFGYICQDDKIDFIPDIKTKQTLIIRCNIAVTSTNFGSYRKVIRPSANDYLIPIKPVCRKSNDNFGILGILSTGTGIGFKIYTDSGLETYNDDRIPFPDCPLYLSNASDKPVKDLEARVSILEEKVASIDSRLKEVERLVGDLPAIVGAVSENVSKLYVAR